MIKREGRVKMKNEEWNHNTRWLAFQVLSPHLEKNAKIDNVFPLEGQKRKPTETAKEMRDRQLAAARLSKEDGNYKVREPKKENSLNGRQ